MQLVGLARKVVDGAVTDELWEPDHTHQIWGSHTSTAAGPDHAHAHAVVEGQKWTLVTLDHVHQVSK